MVKRWLALAPSLLVHFFELPRSLALRISDDDATVPGLLQREAVESVGGSTVGSASVDSAVSIELATAEREAGKARAMADTAAKKAANSAQKVKMARELYDRVVKARNEKIEADKQAALKDLEARRAHFESARAANARANAEESAATNIARQHAQEEAQMFEKYEEKAEESLSAAEKARNTLEQARKLREAKRKYEEEMAQAAFDEIKTRKEHDLALALRKQAEQQLEAAALANNAVAQTEKSNVARKKMWLAQGNPIDNLVKELGTKVADVKAELADEAPNKTTTCAASGTTSAGLEARIRVLEAKASATTTSTTTTTTSTVTVTTSTTVKIAPQMLMPGPEPTTTSTSTSTTSTTTTTTSTEMNGLFQGKAPPSMQQLSDESEGTLVLKAVSKASIDRLARTEVDANADEMAVAKAAIEEFRKERDEAEAEGCKGSLSVHKGPPGLAESSPPPSNASNSSAAFGFVGKEATVARAAVEEWRKEEREQAALGKGPLPIPGASLAEDGNKNSAASRGARSASGARKNDVSTTAPPSRIKWSELAKAGPGEEMSEKRSSFKPLHL